MTTTCINTWDEVWAEFDARQAARCETSDPAAIAAGATPAAPRKKPAGRLRGLIQARGNRADATPRQAPPGQGRRHVKRVLAVMACTLVAVYAGSPVASAVQVAAAIQRGDAAALAHHIDWNTLRPALNAALAAETQRNSAAPMPDFITGMAQDMAERLATPAGLAALLNERLAAGGPQPARDMLSRLRPIEPGLWEVTLTSADGPGRSATLTLALTDPMRLRWEVQAIQLPALLPLRFR